MGWYRYLGGINHEISHESTIRSDILWHYLFCATVRRSLQLPNYVRNHPTHLPYISLWCRVSDNISQQIFEIVYVLCMLSVRAVVYICMC